jgi:LmbE family N-acetylglucosaminyl deacetylase
MKVLVIAPHPDDEAIGCGGSICLHARRGDRVSVAFLTSGELGLKHLPPQDAWRIREAEAMQAAEILGIAQTRFLRLPDWFVGEDSARAAGAVEELLREDPPDRIYVPHANEWHPDHKAAAKAVAAALAQRVKPRPEVLQYEVWSALPAYDHVEDITAVMPQKLAAIRAYVSQLRHFRYDHAIRGLNRYRGALAARAKYAEVFVRQDLPAG